MNLNSRHKLLITLLITALGLLLFAFPARAACVPETQSCDETTDPCCGFPDTICYEGYCQAGPTCGGATEPCCDSPNPPCADGLACSGGYCPTAETCFINATATGGGVFNFGGVCPTHYQDNWDIFVDTLNLATGGGENVSAGGGPYAAGSHTVLLRCYGYYGVDQVRSTECADTFTSAGPPGETCVDDCTSDGDCGTDEVCNKSCDPNGVVGDCITGPGAGKCLTKDGKEGIKTGLGCIPTDPTGLVEKILQIAIGVSSGIALLLLIAGSFKILTSSGDPKAVMGAKDTITSAIAGLLLILLSVAILNIIGFNILGIPFFE